MANDFCLKCFQALYQDAQIACRAHHIAAERCAKYHRIFGPPSSMLLVLVSLYLLGSKEVLILDSAREPLGLFLGLLAVIVGGLSSMYNFKEDLLRHKFAAERFNTLGRRVVASVLANEITPAMFKAISYEFSHVQRASPHVSNEEYKAAVASVAEFPVGGDYPLREYEVSSPGNC